METREISVARALVELKMLDLRLSKAISEFSPTALKVNKKLISVNMQEDEFLKKVKSNRDQFEALFKNRMATKAAIVKSNATTKVKVGAKEMTVAEAIEFKSSIKFQEDFARKMMASYQKSMMDLERANKSMELRIDEQTKAVLGKEAKKDDTAYVDFVKQFKEFNETSLVDPIGVLAASSKVAEEVEDFTANVDIALSESNAKTMIVIPT